MDAAHAFRGGGGRHQKHQVKAMGSGDRGELFGLLQGQVRHHQTGGAGGGGLTAEAVHAAVEQGVAVGEQHHRRGQCAPQVGEHGQHGSRCGARGEGASGGRLDHGAIGEGIAIGNPQLDQIGPGVLQGQQGRTRGGQIRVASHQEGHQGAAFLLPESAEAPGNRR